MAYIDTHAHIYLEDFDEDRQECLDRAREKGVNKIFMPNIDSSSMESLMKVHENYPDLCYPMMGLHPCSVKDEFENELHHIEEELGNQNYVAVGEIGLDFYWDTTYKQQQIETLRFQLELAKMHGLPVVLHCRESLEETIDIVAEHASDGLTGIFHCFTGTEEQALRILDLGFLIGLGGVTTFKKVNMAPVVTSIDLKHIVLETDCPYLAPAPHRGKRNEPAYIPDIARHIAQYHNVGEEEVASITTANALRIFCIDE